MVFEVKRFRQYLYGRPFKLYTEYKPLLGYFKENKKIPARIQHWAIILSAYAYQLEYREGSKNAKSRLPRPTKLEEVPIPEENIMLLEYLDQTPITYQEIARWTKKDKLLKQVLNYVNNGWPDKSPTTEEWRPYFNKRHEIGIMEECILWGRRVIVPIQGRKKLMEALHEGHPGIVRMKGLSRTYFWWPKLDQEIEFKVRNCYECQQTNQMPATAPLHPWEIPEEEWSRLHIDYAGPFKGHMFLVIVEAFIKWLDVYASNSATTNTTLENLQRCFAIHGLPKKIVTDNAAVFVGEEFQTFMSRLGIQHITSPKHPSSNGLAERCVHIFKEVMKKMSQEKGSLSSKLSRFLLSYNSTPQTVTGISPAELLMNRKIKTVLDWIIPQKTTVRERMWEHPEIKKNIMTTLWLYENLEKEN